MYARRLCVLLARLKEGLSYSYEATCFFTNLNCEKLLYITFLGETKISLSKCPREFGVITLRDTSTSCVTRLAIMHN